MVDYQENYREKSDWKQSAEVYLAIIRSDFAEINFRKQNNKLPQKRYKCFAGTDMPPQQTP